jgi:hypothetical protein
MSLHRKPSSITLQRSWYVTPHKSSSITLCENFRHNVHDVSKRDAGHQQPICITIDATMSLEIMLWPITRRAFPTWQESNTIELVWSWALNSLQFASSAPVSEAPGSFLSKIMLLFMTNSLSVYLTCYLASLFGFFCTEIICRTYEGDVATIVEVLQMSKNLCQCCALHLME